MSETQAAHKPLRLLAEDPADLQVISAALQDAVAKIADLSFEPGGRRFTLALNRFRWEAGGAQERVRAAVQFAGVLGVKSRGAPIGDPDAVISILAVVFDGADAAGDPSGAVRLQLAGGGDIRLEVECVDAVLADLSEPWAAIRAPRHRL